MKKDNPDLNYSTIRKNVLNSVIFHFTESDIESGIEIYKLYKDDHSKLSDKTIQRVELGGDNFAPQVTKLASELTETLLKFFRPSTDYTLEDYLNDIEKKIYQVLEDYSFPKKEAEEHIKKLLKNKSFKLGLLETRAFEKTAKAHKKYIDLYAPIFQIFNKHLFYKKYLNEKEPDKFEIKQFKPDNIYFYMAHFLVGFGIEKPTVKTAYGRIKRAINRFEKDIPAYKKFRKKFETS